MENHKCKFYVCKSFTKSRCASEDIKSKLVKQNGMIPQIGDKTTSEDPAQVGSSRAIVDCKSDKFNLERSKLKKY